MSDLKQGILDAYFAPSPDDHAGVFKIHSGYTAGQWAYRCEDHYGYTDWVGSYAPTFRMYAYPIVARTPAGFKIDYHGERKFVLGGQGKRFAYPSPSDALKSWYARKRKQRLRLNAQLDHVNACLDAKPVLPTGYGDGNV